MIAAYTANYPWILAGGAIGLVLAIVLGWV
jgi:hypothetical protein